VAETGLVVDIAGGLGACYFHRREGSYRDTRAGAQLDKVG
jgi:hypothetical protein